MVKRMSINLIIVNILEAMREPSEKMIEAGCYKWCTSSPERGARDTWYAMVDALIAEVKGKTDA